MKRATITGTVVLVLAGFILNVSAAPKGNPYEMIVARNPFGLRPIPVIEPSPPPVAPAPPLPEIKITGIFATLLGAPKALFQYEDKETKKTEFPPLLADGETYKMLSVIRIDPENDRVQIRNGDIEMMLDFVANGLKPAPAMAAAGSPANLASTGFVPNPAGRVIVTGPAPIQTLPPAVLERMKQLHRAQTEQALHSRILPTPGLGDSLSFAP